MFNRYPFSSLLGGTASGVAKAGINWGSLLSNAQKTLGVINQAIPVFYQVKPIWNNAKTMFKVFGEFGRLNSSSNDTTNTTSTANTSNTSTSVTPTDKNTSNTKISTTPSTLLQSSNGPTFFA